MGLVCILKIYKELLDIYLRLSLEQKAFHFGGTKKSDFKFYLKNYIKIIPNKSTILISFGEIDCRHNQGICNHYRKNNISLD